MLSAYLLDESPMRVRAGLDFGAPRTMCINVATRQTGQSGPVAPDISVLTDGQRDCLRLVYQHFTSKDIARMLGVSPHTVDMRLRTAMKALGVGSRIEAARLLVAEEAALGLAAPAIDAYQPLVYQPPEIEGNAELGRIASPASDGPGVDGLSSHDPRPHQEQPSLDVGPPASGPPRLAGASVPNAAAALNMDWPGAVAFDPGTGSRPFLATRPWGAKNDLAIGTRLAWMFSIAVGSALAFGAILAALAALKALI